MSPLSRNARRALALIAHASQAFTGRETCQQPGGGAITVLVHWRTARVLRERGLVELAYSHRAHAGDDTYRVDAIHLTPAGQGRAATIPIQETPDEAHAVDAPDAAEALVDAVPGLHAGRYPQQPA